MVWVVFRSYAIDREKVISFAIFTVVVSDVAMTKFKSVCASVVFFDDIPLSDVY